MVLAPSVIAGLVLAIGVAASLAYWHEANIRREADERRQFASSFSQFDADLQRRMEALRSLAIGMQGLYIASDSISRAEFRRYHANLYAHLQVPGVRALHFTRRLHAAERKAFVARVRGDRSVTARGYPDFDIHPATGGVEHFVIEYIEPFEPNRRAFGLDALSQPVNRESFLAARDSGRISLTAPFELIQAQGGESGLVLRAPVYRHGAPVGTMAERRAAFIGLVGITLDSTAIFSDVFSAPYLAGLCITINDLTRQAGAATQPQRQRVSERCDNGNSAGTEAPARRVETVIPVDGRLWEIRATANKNWARVTTETDPTLVAAAGMVISLLLTVLYLVLERARGEAERLAARMTIDLRQSEQRFRTMAALSSDWFWEEDEEARLVSITGVDGDAGKQQPRIARLIGRKGWDINPAALTPEQWETHRRQRRAQEAFALVYPLPDAAGGEMWLEVHGTPRYDEDGRFLGYHGTARDVSRERLAAREIESRERVLQATLDNITQGISVVDENLHMTAMNDKFCDVLDFPREMARRGASFEAFIRYNAERGEYGPCDIEAKVKEMLALARDFTPHRFMRTRPNGRIVEVVGNPMPGGGFVTTYTDVSERELAIQALRASEARLRRAELAAGSGNWELHLDRGTMIASRVRRACMASSRPGSTSPRSDRSPWPKTGPASTPR
jgi:CHASE1-domain containing sensor protein